MRPATIANVLCLIAGTALGLMGATGVLFPLVPPIGILALLTFILGVIWGGMMYVLYRVEKLGEDLEEEAHGPEEAQHR